MSVDPVRGEARSVLAEGQLRAFLDAAPDAMVVTNHAGTIVFVNAQAETLFGYAREELMGSVVEVLLPERYRRRHPLARDGYFQSPQPRPLGAALELCGLRRDGTEFPAEISLNPVRTCDGLFISSAIRDVTERKAVERQLIEARQLAERADRSKSAFLAAASHDLRQPVQALNLLNSVLSRIVPDGSKAAGALASQANILGVMSDLLNSLLDISKLEAGVVQPSIEDCSVQAIFESLRAQFAEVAEEKGLELVVGDGNAVVRTDAKLLKQIMQNLVANAIRYTERGQVALRATAAAATVRLEVADTGAGIPLEELEKIFEDFYQARGRPGQRKEGFGLGLSVVRRLTELLGHPLEVDSTFGSGTRFAVRVPRGREATGAAIAVGNDERAADAAPGSLIAIVDDDGGVADATALLLDIVGYQTVVAPDLNEVLQRLDALGAEPDVLICDYRLGRGETGADAIRAIRKAYGEAIPAILVSGDTSSSVPALAEQIGGCHLMSKPVRSEALLELIPRLLEA
jgi:PAS domain S-box-containing protein